MRSPEVADLLADVVGITIGGVAASKAEPMLMSDS